MKDPTPVAVTSRAFSRNQVLRSELLERYENVRFNDTGKVLVGEELAEFLRGFPKAIVSLEKVDEPLLQATPGLKVISKYGVGLDSIDLAAVARHGVRIGWKPGVNKRSVSELVIGLAIASLRHVVATNREILSKQWSPRPGAQLTGRTVGVIGCGNIGKDLVRLLRAFDCRILVRDICSYTDFYKEHGVEAVDLDTLLKESEIVTLHIPYEPSTHMILSREKLALMRPDAILINTARGNLVDETALKDLLKEKRLRAAAFDVFAIEPPQDHELLSLPNFIATPHIGGSSMEAILAMGRAAIVGLEEALPVDRIGNA